MISEEIHRAATALVPGFGRLILCVEARHDRLRLAAQQLLYAAQNEPNATVAVPSFFWVSTQVAEDFQNEELLQSMAHLQAVCDHAARKVGEPSIAALEAAAEAHYSEMPPPHKSLRP